MPPTRQELEEFLADAYASGRITVDAYEKFVSALERARDQATLLRIATIVSDRLRGTVVAAPREARATGRRVGSPEEVIDELAAAFYDAISWRDDLPPSLAALTEIVAPTCRFVQGGDDFDVHGFWSWRVGAWTRSSLDRFRQ